VERERQRPGAIERLLGVFADVERGEAATVVLMFANIFLVLLGYYILKTIRDGLLVGGGGMLGLSGAELKSYASAAMALALLGIVPAYGLLASRVPRIRLLNISLGAVVGCLAAFFALGRAGVPVALAFYIWLGVVNYLLIAQFWSYANDIYTEAQGKRLFAIIAIGQSLGAIAGPKIAAAGKAHTYWLMLLAAGVLALAALLYNAVNRREKRLAAGRPHVADVSETPLGKQGGFELLFRERYLLLIGVMLLLLNLVNTTGEYILDTTFEAHAVSQAPGDAGAGERTAIISGLRGDFYFWVNLTGFLIQALLVSRIFKYAGIRVALFVLPVIAFGGYLAVGAIGGLLLLRIAKTAENATDYSLQNTVKQALFLPTSREAKYKAKAAIDTFVVRVGDALSAALVAVGIHALGFGVRGFALANVAIVALWLLVAAGIARRHEQLTAETSP
jgi:AAA family ATP:ADP antiporter